MNFFKYSDGKDAEVGDLIEFGSRSKRFIVTEIDCDGDGTHVTSGNRNLQTNLCVLIARHGERVKR